MAFLLPGQFFRTTEEAASKTPGTPKKSDEPEKPVNPMQASKEDMPRLLAVASPLRRGGARGMQARPSPMKLQLSEAIITEEPEEPKASQAKPKSEPEKKAERLPPVVSVRKMAAKGCAIVLLRDSAVLELSVAMKVAVVGGVCVQVTRHTRKARGDDEEEEQGVFVAWGHRVENKVPVSEEAIEDYFNGLSDVGKTPAGLTAKPPFEEELQRFELTSTGPLPLNKQAKKDEASAEQMLQGPHGKPELVRSLWKAKQELDDIWNKPPPPMGRSLMQRVARDELFPHSGKEGKEHENRAGEKLEELATAVGLLEGVPPGAAFLDLCGGPGAWSQFLLDRPNLPLQGYGFTLRSYTGKEDDWQAEEKDDWYPDLLENPNWTALWGADGSGDLLKPWNLEHSAQQLRDRGGVFLCVADGGFSDKSIPPNQLELYFYRLFLGEILMAASCLQPGGRFVCKLYTSCSTATSALLFLTTRLFDHVSVVKPMTSRVSGPERYLYASGFRVGQETKEIISALTSSQNIGAGASPFQVPLLTPIVAASNLIKDEQFLKQLQAMVGRLLERQAGSLRATLDRAEELEELALGLADEAEAGAVQWEAAAAARREQVAIERAARHAEKDRQREERRRTESGYTHRGGRGNRAARGEERNHQAARPGQNRRGFR